MFFAGPEPPPAGALRRSGRGPEPKRNRVERLYPWAGPAKHGRGENGKMRGEEVG